MPSPIFIADYTDLTPATKAPAKGARTACALSPSFAPEGAADVTGGVARFGTWVLPFSTGFQLDGAALRQLHLTASHWFIGDQAHNFALWAGECEIRLLMPANASDADVIPALSGLAGALSSYYKQLGGTAPVYVKLLLSHLRPHTPDGENCALGTTAPLSVYISNSTANFYTTVYPRMCDAFEGFGKTHPLGLDLKKEEAPELINLAHDKEDAISAIITKFNMQAALVDPPQDLHNVQEHVVVGQAEQAPPSTGGGGDLMIGDGGSDGEDVSFDEGGSDDEGMTLGEPSTATTMTAAQRRPNRTAKPSSVNPKKHNRGKTGTAAKPQPQAATTGKRKAPMTSDDESEVEEAPAATKVKKESRKWYLAVDGLLNAEARRILAKRGIHHPTKEQIDETITEILRDAVLRMHRMTYPNEPLPTTLNIDDPQDRVKITAIMAHCVPRYQKIFKEDNLFGLLNGEDPAAKQLFPTRDLLNLYITTATAKRMGKWSGLFCVVAEALHLKSTKEISDQTHYFEQQRLAKNGN